MRPLLKKASSSVAFSYDAANRRTSLTLPNGITLAYSYDQDSRVTGMTWTLGGNPVGNLGYSYDADGRVTAKTGSFAQTNLPQAVSGNTFNAANEMTGFNGTALSYDLNGNLTGDGTNTYTWDARNHLASISGGTTASFVYDAFGRRMSKNINGSITQFEYDGLNPVQELDGASPANVTANLLTGLRLDEFFQRTDLAGLMDFLSDTLGSTLALSDSTGAVQTQYTYEPFGNVTASGTANSNQYQFIAGLDPSGLRIVPCNQADCPPARPIGNSLWLPDTKFSSVYVPRYFTHYGQTCFEAMLGPINLHCCYDGNGAPVFGYGGSAWEDYNPNLGWWQYFLHVWETLEYVGKHDSNGDQ